MGRRKKNRRKNYLVLIGIIMVAICCLVAVKVFYLDNNPAMGPLLPNQENPTLPEDEPKLEEPIEKVYVNVFFIGQNSNKEEVYRAVKREYDEQVDGSKIKFAVKSLVAGPLSSEKSRGVYSEIPAGTSLISVVEEDNKVIINLSSAFENGGGTDSLYKRVYQVIKTARNNTTKPVYLYLDGRKVEVLGGEGLMLTQPLTENSLDG